MRTAGTAEPPRPRVIYRTPAAQRYHSSECSRVQQTGLLTRSRGWPDSTRPLVRSAASHGAIAAQIARPAAIEYAIRQDVVEVRYRGSMAALLPINRGFESLLFAYGAWRHCH